ncbi:hypothetical protein [Jidongwangia harbinensis]|uniref:hypothetical protein n=1 Tax=Jidongwangia harbinensis TaxID=2878561 RepID=UPI001CDA03CA|nr:hypothetical protein [Jidongwangia harbinensis]MCA2218037.1 hypothetical protein [Jidongwangia harbinensis]
MTGPPTVRTSRYELAKALMVGGANDEEADRQLTLALGEAGDQPPEWLLHLELGRLRRHHDPVGAVRNFLDATRTASQTDVEPAAEEALAALVGVEDGSLRHILSDDDLAALRARARADDAPAALVRLVASLLMLRGDAAQGLDLLVANPTNALPSTDLQRMVDAAAYIRGLIADDQWQEAAELIAGDQWIATEPGLAADRALIYYALGREDRAAGELPDQATRFPEAVVRLLLALQRAALLAGAERREAFTDALDLAVAATQIASAGAEASLLRAQVLLEGALDLDEGRRLLRSALRRLRDDLDGIAWWRAQQKVRRDELYAYFRIEVAAALGDDKDVLARAATAGSTVTDYLQDGAIAELEGEILEKRGDIDGAADAHCRAARAFQSANDRTRAVDHLRTSLSQRPDQAAVCDLAELLWESSFPADVGGDADAAAIEEALTQLATVSEPATDELAVRLCFLTGLAVTRQAELTRNAGRRWSGLPHLLVAALTGAEPAYRAAHAAWALQSVSLHRAAWLFAERAVGGGPVTDAWLAETAIVMRFDWAGQLDARSRDMLELIQVGAWRDSLLAYDSLLRGDLEALQPMLDRDDLTEPWMRQVRAYGVARCRGYAEAVPLFGEILKDCLATHNAITAGDCAVLLDNIDTAREQTALAVAAGDLDRCAAALRRALLKVLEGDLDAAAEVSSRLEREFRPYLKRSYAHADLPTLIAEHAAATPELSDVLRRLRTTAEVAGDDLEFDRPPTAELDAGCVGAPEPELDRVVGTLLRAGGKLSEGNLYAVAAALGEVRFQPELNAAAFVRCLSLAAAR